VAGSDEPEAVARRFVDAFAANDLHAMRALLAPGFSGHITTADGGTREVGADAYVEGVAEMDVPSANLQLSVNDVTAIDADSVMLMVEVHAERRGRRLHNFSGQLVRVRDGVVVELWMVDALPAESDEFWAS